MSRKPTHPGEILKEDVFPAMKLNASQAAKILQISRQYMSDILNARKPMTPVLCLKIAKLVGNEPQVWANMQSRYNLWEAAQDQETRKVLKTISNAADAYLLPA